jgi:hypothetical protein
MPTLELAPAAVDVSLRSGARGTLIRRDCPAVAARHDGRRQFPDIWKLAVIR